MTRIWDEFWIGDKCYYAMVEISPGRWDSGDPSVGVWAGYESCEVELLEATRFYEEWPERKLDRDLDSQEWDALELALGAECNEDCDLLAELSADDPPRSYRDEYEEWHDREKGG